MSQAPAQLNLAATILLLRDEPSFEVLMVKRHHQIDFASGALVFPGGKSHAGDATPEWSDHVIGWERFEPEMRALRIAAVREVFEEAGILLARGRDGAGFDTTGFSLDLRKAVDAGETPFIDVVREAGVQLDLEALVVFARWVTPAGVPKRFDTWFFAIKAPADQLAACDGRETVDAEWLSPTEALRLGQIGERKIIFPTRMNLKRLAEAQSAADALARASARPHAPVHTQIVERPEGRFLVLPAEAGYGLVEEPMDL